MSGRVDVVIVTHETREVVLSCVRSLSRATSLRRCIVIDNGSSDGTTEALRAEGTLVRVIRNDKHESFARSCNRGVAAGSAPYVLFLNSDIVAHDDAVDRLSDFLDRNSDHVVAAGALVDSGTLRPQVGFAIRGYPTLAAQIALLIGLERQWPTNPISKRQVLPHFDYSVTQTIEAQPAGACILCRRSALEAEGGFDENFELWFEDVDLLARMRSRGRVGYVHDAIFEHVGGLTAAARAPADLIRPRYLGLLRYFKKHHSRGEYLGLRAAVALVAVVRAAAALPVDRRAASAYAGAATSALRGA